MSVFLDACLGRPVPYTPIWLMRQAGRYQPEYRALRERYGFLELCRNPDLVAEVTALPITQFGLDAAIIFADILLILEPLGVRFSFDADHGPVIHEPLRSPEQIERLASAVDVNATLPFVLEGIRRTKQALPQGTPLIGFAGAPFTLASYAIDGGGSRNYLETKTLMRRSPDAWHALMTKIVDATARYLNAQVDAGADALQVFDSWVGCLSEPDYTAYVVPHMRRLFAALPTHVPTIHFGTGNPELYPAMASAGGHVLGVDWRITLERAATLVPNRPLMGNLDPTALVGSPEAMIAETTRVLDSARSLRSHIFNLGHGILPQTPLENVRRLVDFVHEKTAKGP